MTASKIEQMGEISAEGARYALLRRLAPAIRHRVVGRLHPIGLIAEALEWQMKGSAPDLVNVRDSVARINALSRSAMLSFTTHMTWLVPEDGATAMLNEAVADCLELLQTDFSLRGFSIQNEVLASDISISLNAVRHVFTAALIAITDAAPAPAKLVLSADASKKTHALLSVWIRPGGEVSDVEQSDAYRRLEWTEVQALAAAESVNIFRNADRVEMSYRILE
jgi:hypothetical protein